jgi:hypothetical protein
VCYNQSVMAYIILIALFVLPLTVFALLVMLLATGVIREPEGAEAAAQGYRHSWHASRR